jgi:hypothetical protein
VSTNPQTLIARPYWNTRRILVLVLAVVGAGVWLGLIQTDILPQRLIGVVVFFLVLPLPFLLGAFLPRSISGILREFLGPIRHYKVFDEGYPSYRYVDLFRALERLAAASAGSYRLEHYHQGNLYSLLIGPSLGVTVQPQQTRICVGYEEHAFFPSQVLWLLEGPPGFAPDERVAVRLRLGCMLEVASTHQARAQALLKWLAKESLARSIYRGQFLELHYRHSPHPDYEYEIPAEEMTVSFKARPNLADGDIILDERVRAILGRNVFDFFTHRDCLYSVGVPRKRALLFYGPPGTGKTHTCRYLHSKLAGVTSILVAGESLTRLQDIGKFARQFHPTLLVIEDVDLVFANREHNPYGTILGELMDQLDGFTADEEVLFILTTNAIERVEQAIRDRPGRINQCLFFGLPGSDLRRLYLLRYLQPYDIAAVDLDHLVHQTEHTSQAFLKEYVLRSVQVAVESAGYQMNGRLKIETAHFDVAFDELTSHGNPAGHAIMGFRLHKE